MNCWVPPMHFYVSIVEPEVPNIRLECSHIQLMTYIRILYILLLYNFLFERNLDFAVFVVLIALVTLVRTSVNVWNTRSYVPEYDNSQISVLYPFKTQA
jgi:flagellar biosynthesis component FlhA